ncbi:piggyBac transposable element-derived protein 4-like [Ischnura elegans]|uniref:piggyBac transposable element-derived protein 4-like n=1 Tax=Ischnura elegans TaxID=197161 RepID=UPI001ED8A14F|nr:piggyBac transposable element-derived protein 4-like [Ischnura elegans]
MQALHFNENPGENDPEPSDRLYKIRPLLDFFEKRMREIDYPNRSLSLDESMLLWRGRLLFRQYVQGKRHKFGIKIYMLTEPSGLVHRLLIYAGAGDKDVGGKGHAGKVVHSLLTDFKNKGHAIYMDNFYNSVELSRQLLREKTYTTGTLRSQRVNNPPDVIKQKLRKGEEFHQWSDDGVCVLKWRDRREVLALSTEFGAEMVEVLGKRNVRKPRAVVEYNRCMGGIDHFDQYMSYYTCEHRTLKWYKKVAIHIFQIMLLNSYLLYNKYSGEKRICMTLGMK